MVGGVQLFVSLSLLIIIGYMLRRYSYIFVAQALILTGKRSLKRQMIKEVTKEKGKKRQENQKNEVIKRKGKNKNKKNKEKENMKVNQQAAVDKSLPGVQARCAVLFIFYFDGRWWMECLRGANPRKPKLFYIYLKLLIIISQGSRRAALFLLNCGVFTLFTYSYCTWYFSFAIFEILYQR